MLGVFVNVLTVLAGSTLGLIFRKVIPDHWTDFVMKGIGLCTIYIGIDGALTGQNTLVTIISIAVGALIGVITDPDKHLNRLANGIENRFKKPGETVSIAEGFVSGSLLFCVGAMTIVGSLQSGLTGDHTMIFTKATLDFVSSLIFAATLGIGVMLSAVFVLVFQGSLVLVAQAVSPFLSEYVIGEMTCVGSILILALGLNIIGVTNFKVMNYLPAIFLPIVLCMFM